MENIERKAFMFYLNWKDQIDELEDQELRRLINNLINYHKGEEIVLETKIDRIMWQGILPALQVNDDKYANKVAANRENGKLGGRPSKTKFENNPTNPNGYSQNPNNLITENREEVIDKSKMESDNWEMKNEKEEMTTDNTKNEDIKVKTPRTPTTYSSSVDNSYDCGGISMAEFNRRRPSYN